jgi:hypothetical protein
MPSSGESTVTAVMSSRGPTMFCGSVSNCTDRVAEIEQRLREDDLRPHEGVAVGQANHRVALFGEHGHACGARVEIGAV